MLPLQPHPDTIPKYHDYLLARSKAASPPSFFTDIAHIVSASLSPVQSDSPSDTGDDDRLPSPQSPSANYGYANRNSGSFGSPSSTTEMYADHNGSTYPPSAHQYSGYRSSEPLRSSDIPGTYLDDSPSPDDGHPTSTISDSLGPGQQQPRSSHSGQQHLPEGRISHAHLVPDRFPRPQADRFSSHHHHIMDQRRMSEPAVLSGANSYAPEISSGNRYQQYNFAYHPPALNASRSPAPLYISRGASTGSLRDLRNQHLQYPPHGGGWKEHDKYHRNNLEYYDQSGGFDEPISPCQPNFTGGVVGSPTSGLPYSPITENTYGPSPPGTGTSTSSSAPLSAGVNCGSSRSPPYQFQRNPSANSNNSSGDSSDRKTYSFVALPGNAVKKRPRRRYDEIERLYQCSWPDCNKAYGTLNHLNAHVTMQKHGSKRNPNEFKELRKQWRKAKKESEAPSSTIMRRSSFNARHGEYDYDHRYGQSPHVSHHRQHPSRQPDLGMPSSVPIPQPITRERYSGPVDDVRYSVQGRDGHPLHHPDSPVRQRYSDNLPNSWNGTPPLSSRASLHQPYLSSSLPSHHAHHSQLPQLSIQPSHAPSHHSPLSPMNMAMNRLPQNSTLLTPLPGYQASSLLPPLAGHEELNYGESYEVYENDSRPGTGHTSLGPGSADEYDRR